MLFIILALTGIFVGLLSAFFGVGGGVLIVPVLYGLFPDTEPSVIIGTSLSVIFINSVLNSYNFKKLKLNVKYSWGLILALGMVIGILITSQYIKAIDPKQVRLIFGIVLFATALRTAFFKPPEDNPESTPELNSKTLFLLVGTGLGGGAIAGLTGLGGGIVMVPLLMTLVKVPLRMVPIYSNLAMAGGTLIGGIRYAQIHAPNIINEGFLRDYQWGSVQIAVALIIFAGSSLSSRFGAGLTQKVSKVTSKRLFIVLLIVMGGRIVYGALS